jgi:hypothetical protein
MSASNKTALFDKYIASLSEKELQAYHIAKSHLGSSFSLEKSKGFIEWKIRHEINISSTSIS